MNNALISQSRVQTKIVCLYWKGLRWEKTVKLFKLCSTSVFLQKLECRIVAFQDFKTFIKTLIIFFFFLFLLHYADVKILYTCICSQSQNPFRFNCQPVKIILFSIIESNYKHAIVINAKDDGIISQTK